MEGAIENLISGKNPGRMALPLAFLQVMRRGNVYRCGSKPEVQRYHKVQILEWYHLRLARRNDQLATPCIESDVTTSAYHFLNHTLADLLYARYLTNHATIYIYTLKSLS